MKFLIYSLFIMSGFVGLIYEAIWSRYLKLLFGHSSYGQILTLITFMGGIGLGSFIAGRMVPRLKNPFKTYAIIELLAGAGGMLFHRAFSGTLDFYFARIAATEMSDFSIVALRVVLGLLVTLPVATLLGMTFPVIAVGLLRLNRDAGKNAFSLLYFCNSIGAAFGILITSYYLLKAFGTETTLTIAGSGNILVALGFYLVAKKVGDRDPEPVPEAPVGDEARTASKAIPFWLFVAFGTGFASFIYEIGWIRLLSLVMGSSTHSFDVMVSAFVFGLAFGGLASKGLIRRFPNIGLAMAFVQVAMGICAFMTIYLYQEYFGLVNGIHDVLIRNDKTFVIYSLFKYLVSLSLMFPACFFAGMTLPLVTHYLVKQTNSERFTGYVYGWNTCGGIAGAVMGGLFLIPLFQLKWTIGFGAALDILLGVLILFRVAAPKWCKVTLPAVAAVVILPCFFFHFDIHTITSGVFRSQFVAPGPGAAEEKIVLRHGRAATISFHGNAHTRQVKTNGKSDGMSLVDPSKPYPVITDDATMACVAFLPMQTRNEPYTAAIIGMGTGLSLHYLLADPLLVSVDLIEIEKEMIELSKNMGELNERAFTDPRVNFIVADAKSYFYANRKKYDLIISEPSNPWVSGVSGLFTQEFYAHIKGFLNPGGALVQWSHLYDFDDNLLLSILTALQEFEHFEIYDVQEVMDIVIIASEQPLTFYPADRFVTTPSINDDFVFRNWKHDNFGPWNFIISSKTLAPVLETFSSLANSDYYPYLDQNAELSFYKRDQSAFLAGFNTGYSQYQEIFEPERYRALKVDMPSESADDYQADRLRRLVPDLKHADASSEWPSLERRFMKAAAELLPRGKWKDEPVVQHFRAAVEQGFTSELASLQFRILDRIGNGEIDAAVELMPDYMASLPANKMSPLWMRCLAVNFYRTNRIDLYEQLYRKFVLNHTSLPVEERSMIDALFVEMTKRK